MFVIQQKQIKSSLNKMGYFENLRTNFLPNSTVIFAKKPLDVRLVITVLMFVLVCALSFILKKIPEVKFTPEIEFKGKVLCRKY